ncbi:MAG TPA: signal peptidase II [Firmicutes bacterium]|nr:signal peptidase II [Bacillota bacterium]
MSRRVLKLRCLLILGVLVVMIDQASKAWVTSGVRPGESIPIIRGALHITHVRNPGVAFGMLAGKTGLIITLVILVGVLAVVLAVRSALSTRVSLAGAAIIAGGALGNLIDRVRVGRVIDFIDLRVWPVFNLADVAIVVGAGLVLLGTVEVARNRS